MVRIAITLQTCDRPDYTRRTLETFSAQHPDARDQFLLLHGDDGSTDRTNRELAATHGFETVVAHPTRRGARATRAALIDAVRLRGLPWLLLLENDWEWSRPFPFALFDYLVTTRPDVYTLRLYGVYKARDQRLPCGTVDRGEPRRPRLPWWRLPGAPEPVEIGRMHWGAPPAVTRLRELQQIRTWTTGKTDRGDAAEVVVSGRIDAYAARVVENCVFHIGDERTAAARPAVARPHRRRFVAFPQGVPIRRPTMRAQPIDRPIVERYSAAWQVKRRWTIPGAVNCFDRALRLLDPPGSVLDVGCGEGAIVTRAKAAGLEALGVDLSAPPGSTGPVRRADLREPLDLGRRFDWVLCWEVAEHLPPESAETLVDSLVRHLAPGGRLLFTAAAPGQGGDGHLNEQPRATWRALLEARGLRVNDTDTAALASAWTATAPRQPWYGANVIVAEAPGVRAVAAARVAVTIRTADRSPNPNYVGGTVQRLLAQGIAPADIHVCATSPEIGWLLRELKGAPVSLHVPDRILSPNENGLAQIRHLDPDAWDLVLLLEDDLEFCARFVPSVARWFRRYGRANRHLFRLFGFRVHPPSVRVHAYDTPLDRSCAGSQAVLLRIADARDFLAWGDANLERWGHFRGNSRIAFDKLLAAWSNARWPGAPGVMSQPFFVRHIGDVSSIHPRAIRNDRYFAGASWSFVEATC